jgi:hypothetical protein
MGRRVLVVTTVRGAEAALRDLLPPDVDEIEVVVPAVRQGVLDWLANDERAFSEAQEAAERQADQLPGDVVEARAGEADVELAIRDALATFPADEVVVAVRPDDGAGVVEQAATRDLPRTVDGVPVRLVVLDSA